MEKLDLEIDANHWWLVRLKALFQLERSSSIHQVIFNNWYKLLLSSLDQILGGN